MEYIKRLTQYILFVDAAKIDNRGKIGFTRLLNIFTF